MANWPVEARDEHLERIEHVVGGSMIVYVFTLEETLAKDFQVMNRSGLWEQGLDGDDQQLLMALRHLRHTASHGYRGRRADTGSGEFDALAENRLRHLWRESNDDTIVLHSSAGFHTAQEFHGLTQKAINKLASG
jgi:hypothetical protein